MPHVLLAVGRAGGRAGKVTTRFQTLGDHCGVTARAAELRVRELEKAGFVKVVDAEKGRSARVTIYVNDWRETDDPRVRRRRPGRAV